LSTSPGFNSYTRGMRSATAFKLAAPSFAEMAICASVLLHPNVLAFLLASLMFAAFVPLIVAVAIATKHSDQTSWNAWTCLALAGVAQMLSFLAVSRF
jgi:hypothetical protein